LTQSDIKEHYNGSASYQIRQAIGGGCDLECGNFYFANIIQAVESGVLSEALLDQATIRVMTYNIWLGTLDGSAVSYKTLGAADVDSPAHRQLALNAAQQGIILLKNEGDLLPLAKEKRVAIIGPHANATRDMLSIYVGDNTLVNSHSPYQAISNSGVKTTYAVGSALYGTDTSGFAEAVGAAKDADVAIVFIGLHPGQGQNDAREDEGWDRNTVELPAIQTQLVQAIVATGKPTVVVLIHGGPLAIEWIKTNVPAIVDAHYPGELGGDAIASILFGDVSPSGRLTTTIYPSSISSQRDIEDMGLQDKGGITYQYYTGTPLWEFGFGLSYTTFSFTLAAATTSATTEQVYNSFSQYYTSRGASFDSGISYVVTVTNTGKVVKSDVSVLGFLSSGVAGQPIKELFGYGRVSNLAPGSSANVKLNVPAQVISQVDFNGTEVIQAGTYKVTLGAPDNFVSSQFTITGKPYVVFTFPQ